MSTETTTIPSETAKSLRWSTWALRYIDPKGAMKQKEFKDEKTLDKFIDRLLEEGGEIYSVSEPQ